MSRLLTSATAPFCHGDTGESRGHREDGREQHRTGNEHCMTLIREVTARGPDQPPHFLKLSGHWSPNLTGRVQGVLLKGEVLLRRGHQTQPEGLIKAQSLQRTDNFCRDWVSVARTPWLAGSGPQYGTKPTDFTLVQQPALRVLSHCPSAHLSPVWSCPNSCDKILMLLAREPQPSADQFSRSLPGSLGAAQGSLGLKANI